MDRRDRTRYDDYDRDYSSGAGYSPNDEHYHSARNLTSEFEQHYRGSHPDHSRRHSSGQGSYPSQRSARHESNYGSGSSRGMGEGDYGSRQQSWGSHNSPRSSYDRHNSYSSSGDNFGSRYSDRDRYSSTGSSFASRHGDRDRYSDQNRSSGNRYSSNQNRYSESGRYGGQRDRGGDSTREGYGISDYGNMHESQVRSSRGIPDEGITDSFADDYGTGMDRNRTQGISSGNFSPYGQQGNNRRYESDRFGSRY